MMSSVSENSKDAPLMRNVPSAIILEPEGLLQFDFL